MNDLSTTNAFCSILYPHKVIGQLTYAFAHKRSKHLFKGFEFRFQLREHESVFCAPHLKAKEVCINIITQIVCIVTYTIIKMSCGFSGSGSTFCLQNIAKPIMPHCAMTSFTLVSIVFLSAASLLKQQCELQLMQLS